MCVSKKMPARFTTAFSNFCAATSSGESNSFHFVAKSYVASDKLHICHQAAFVRCLSDDFDGKIFHSAPVAPQRGRAPVIPRPAGLVSNCSCCLPLSGKGVRPNSCGQGMSLAGCPARSGVAGVAHMDAGPVPLPRNSVFCLPRHGVDCYTEDLRIQRSQLLFPHGLACRLSDIWRNHLWKR